MKVVSCSGIEQPSRTRVIAFAAGLRTAADPDTGSQQPMVLGGRDNWAVTGVSLGRSPMVRRFSNDGHDGWESVGDILRRLRG